MEKIALAFLVSINHFHQLAQLRSVMHLTARFEISRDCFGVKPIVFAPGQTVKMSNQKVKSANGGSCFNFGFHRDSKKCFGKKYHKVFFGERAYAPFTQARPLSGLTDAAQNHLGARQFHFLQRFGVFHASAQNRRLIRIRDNLSQRKRELFGLALQLLRVRRKRYDRDFIQHMCFLSLFLVLV